MTAGAADTPLEVLRAFVSEAWAKRSPEERHAYAGGTLDPSAGDDAAGPVAGDPITWGEADGTIALAPPAEPFVVPEPLPPSFRTARQATRDDEPEEIALAAAAEAVERVAAVSGAVQAGDLVSSLPAPLGRAVLGRLAPRFDRTLVDSERNDWSWVHGHLARREILAALDPPALAAALQAARDVPTDPAGDLLRCFAAGDRPDASAFRDRPAGALQEVVQALSWALPLDPALEPLLADVRRLAEGAALLAGFDRLLADGFVGRERELERLRRFASEADADPSRPVPILGVSGLGGTGKSTLLAQLLRPLADAALHDETAPLVILLDFDRRSFIAGGELEWSFEATRQIGLFVPACREPLAELRARFRDDRGARGDDRASPEAMLESVHRDASAFDWQAGYPLRDAGLAKRGVVLVLDTFEEWQRSAWSAWDRNAAALRALEWVHRLSSALGIRPRVIVSGRAPANVTGYAAAADPIRLGDLSHADAAALLRRFGTLPREATTLARLVGGNPLSLKLAARHLLALPTERRADFLRDDAMLPDGLAGALRQGVLYRRFLDHIPDTDVRRLAHPGLALRQVTPDLIRGVLAGPCGLGAVPPERADALFATLEREVWLVEREGDALVHRPDVRRAMLAQMASDPDQAPRVRAVHDAAAAWFDGTDPAEALYHRLALGQLDVVAAAVSSGLLQQLVGAFDDFDPSTRALLRETLGLRLTATDAALLPGKLHRRWVSARAADLVARGQPASALRFWNKSGFPTEVLPWFAQAAFQAPAWGTSIPYDHASADGDLGRGRLAYEYLLAFSRPDPHWRRTERAAVNRFEEQRLDLRHGAPFIDAELENIFFREATAGPDDPPPALPEVSTGDAVELSKVDIRRTALLASEAIDLGRIDARHLLVRAFRPAPRWLDGVIGRMRDLGMDRVPVGAFARELDGLRGRVERAPSTAELLGGWAQRFADSMREASPVPPPPLAIIAMLGWRGDDPEWRVPIRGVLTAALADPARFRTFAERIDGLHEITPEDLATEALVADHARAPRGMWLRLVEYADRCGRLGDLLAAAGDDPAIVEVADAYNRWDRACHALIARHRPDRLAGETA